MSFDLFTLDNTEYRLWNAGYGELSSFMLGAVTRRDGVPESMPVLVFSRYGNRRLVAHTRSDSGGKWQIQYLSRQREYVIEIFDETKALNSAVLDWVVPGELNIISERPLDIEYQLLADPLPPTLGDFNFSTGPGLPANNDFDFSG